MTTSATIGLHLLEVNNRRILSLQSCLYDRGLHVCKTVRKLFTANQAIRHIPLFSSNTLHPIDCINIEYFGIQEMGTTLIHVPQDNGRFRCCLQVRGENVPGYSSCGPELTSVTFVLPLIEYDCEQNNSSLLTEKLEMKLALSGSILYYLNEITGVRHKSYVAILDRLYANVRDKGDSPLLVTFLDQSGALRDYGDANLAQLPLLPGLTPEERRDQIMRLRPGFQGRPRSPNSGNFQTQFNDMRGYRADANQRQSQRMPPPVDLGDNTEFFFKCNVSLEPDTRPYKEPFL